MKDVSRPDKINGSEIA